MSLETNLFVTLPSEAQHKNPDLDRMLISENRRDGRRTKEDAETADIDGNRKLKKRLAYKTFDFMVRFVNFIGIILIFYVGHFISNGKPLPENFMIALVTTTLATVIGLVGFILKGLFGTK
ncbi:hypothetical protein VCSRO157_3540 [Vibrio cholerae]|nr:hypothetical protein VCSRO157_3540 [Vibrio cholerae]